MAERGPRRPGGMHQRCSTRGSRTNRRDPRCRSSIVVSGLLLALVSFPTWSRTADAKVVPNGGMVWEGNGWISLVDDDSDPKPPPPKTSSWKTPEATLFLGVSSFRDKRCPMTLKNYFTKAKHPERVTIGVVQQNDGGNDVDCLEEYCKLMGTTQGRSCPHEDNIRILRVDSKLAAGPCYGRHLQSYMLREEEFCMQTDSHMDVVQDWDHKMLKMWGRVNNEYGILTTYVHKIEQMLAGSENKKEVPHLCQLSFTHGNHPRYVQAKIATDLKRPKLTNTWAAGFSLAKCHAWRAAPYDPALRMVFDGEEFTMHARLWTRGYDTYTPDKSLIGHDYNRVEEGPKPSSWISNPMAAGTKQKAYDRLFTLMGMPGKIDTPEMKESIGKYGLGTKRTLEQYQEFVGVNLSTLEITGSRCGTLRHVPFEETWPPTENNLGGPYWERVLSGKGVHAEGYESPFRSQGNGDVVVVHNRLAEESVARGEAGVGMGIFTTGVVVMAVLACCVMTVARYAGDTWGSSGRQFVVPRKSRSRARARKTPLLSRAERDEV